MRVESGLLKRTQELGSVKRADAIIRDDRTAARLDHLEREFPCMFEEIPADQDVVGIIPKGHGNGDMGGGHDQ